MRWICDGIARGKGDGKAMEKRGKSEGDGIGGRYRKGIGGGHKKRGKQRLPLW
jgi:hypothetical protein